MSNQAFFSKRGGKAQTNMLLSIIIPFHNSAKKCDRLLATLRSAKCRNVELILVDDGSVDSTLSLLERFKTSCKMHCVIISQTNKGPGGARNAGIEAMQGKYCWFVDSDDDIDLYKAVEVLEREAAFDYDVIDFDVWEKGFVINTTRLRSGIYQFDHGPSHDLLKNFGRIWSKIFSSKIFKDNYIRYPEYCVFEDNPMQLIIPFYIRRLLKVTTSVYIYRTDSSSITRRQGTSAGGGRDPKYYDRLKTARWGFYIGEKLSTDSSTRAILVSRLIKLYAINTVRLRRRPSLDWILKVKVLRQFREDCDRDGISVSLFAVSGVLTESGASVPYIILFSVFWMISYTTASNAWYFEAQRKIGWGFEFPIQRAPTALGLT